MALSLRNAGTVTQTASGASTTITPGACTFVAGDLFILTLGSYVTGDTWTTPTGFTLFATRTNHHSIYGRIAVGGDTPPLCTSSGTSVHTAGLLALQGTVWPTIGTMAEATNNAFQSSASAAAYPSLTIAGQPGFASNNDYILIYGQRNKTDDTDGATWATVAGATKLQEIYGNGFVDAWTLQGIQQTTRTDISAGTIAATGGTPESVATTGLVIALRTALASAGILSQLIQHSR